MKQPLTHEHLTSLLYYGVVSGRFYWRVALKHTTIKPGDRAGYLMALGYRYITIDRRGYGEHRLAWFYVTGEWPAEDTDHKNGMRDQNQFINLRSVTHKVNLQNQRRARTDNTTGFLGVHKNHKRFGSKIGVDGAQVYLGTFDTPEEAHAAHVAAKREAHEGCTL